MSKQNVVWEVVKHLKEKTDDGVVVDVKYTHVCVSPITSTEAGEVGVDVDSDGNSLWFCDKVFSLSKTKKGDLLETDILMIFRQVLREEESLVKVGGQTQVFVTSEYCFIGLSYSGLFSQCSIRV